MPLRNHYVQALELQGSRQVPGKRSDRMVRMTNPSQPGTFFFVGNSSKILVGRRVDQSRSVPASQKVKLLEQAIATLGLRIGTLKQ